MSNLRPAFRVGDRVRYQNGAREVAGVVTRIYPGYVYCDEDGEIEVDTHYAVQVDSLPDWWPYINNDTFAPGEENLSYD